MRLKFERCNNAGDRYRFWIPKSLAYGENPRPDQPKGMLVFDAELFEIH